jgi:phage terminase large subunit-like protein
MFDPYQLVTVAQRLTAAGLPMQEFPQTVSNLTEASTNLYELIKGRNLMAYPDADMRLSASRAVALETSRGWRIAKEKQSHKIDVVVALAQARARRCEGWSGGCRAGHHRLLQTFGVAGSIRDPERQNGGASRAGV